jgi:hypothetical protein
MLRHNSLRSGDYASTEIILLSTFIWTQTRFFVLYMLYFKYALRELYVQNYVTCVTRNIVWKAEGFLEFYSFYSLVVG